MTYDGNRLLTRTDPSGLTLTYSYDDAGNVSSVQDSQGGLTTYTYNAANQVISKTFQDGTTQLRVDFTYDQAGNVLTETRYTDVAGTQLAGTTQYGYNGANQVTSIVQTAANGVVLGSFSYTYNLAGQVTAQTVNGVTTAYAYDATGQLIAAGGQSYNYDANGNPDSSGDSIGPDNELLSDGAWNYTYDGAGNLIQKVSIDGSTVWTYGYNVANQMTSAAEVVDGVTVLSIAYSYDVFGNRVGEMVLQGDSETTTEYLYDASNTLYATAGSSGTVQMWYMADVQGPDTWLAQLDNTGSGNSAWLLSDYEGSVTTVEAMGSGAFTQMTYDAFGNTTNVSYFTVSGTPTTAMYAPAQGLLGFQGGQWDAVVLVYRFGIRYENPQTGQWTTTDPEGLLPGPNPRAFVNNAPTNATDATGMAEKPVGSNKYGQFFIDQNNYKPGEEKPLKVAADTAGIPASYWISDVVIRFHPEHVNATQIGFIQMVRTIDGETQTPIWGKGDEALRARSIDGGFAIDRDPDNKYAWYGLQNNGTFNPKAGNTDPSKGDVTLEDDPSYNKRNVRFEFETAVVAKTGPEAGLVYGTVLWGIYVDKAGNMFSYTPELRNYPSDRWTAAANRWNDQVGFWWSKNDPDQQKFFWSTNEPLRPSRRPPFPPYGGGGLGGFGQ
jgi:RHS repeat-associated protein